MKEKILDFVEYTILQGSASVPFICKYFFVKGGGQLISFANVVKFLCCHCKFQQLWLKKQCDYQCIETAVYEGTVSFSISYKKNADEYGCRALQFCCINIQVRMYNIKLFCSFLKDKLKTYIFSFAQLLQNLLF